MADPIDIGLIGCGQVAMERHLPALRQVPAVRVTALADPDEEALHRTADRYGIPHVFTDYRQVLDRADVQAVGVLTPPDAHGAVATAAMQAGKHVLIEKPLAIEVEDCVALEQTAATTRVKAMVCFNLRRHRLVRQARQIIRSGALGPIAAIRSVYTHHRDAARVPEWKRHLASGGGVTFHEAVHHFDLWRFLLGCDVTQVSALHRSSEGFEDDSSVVCAQLDNGSLGSLVASYSTAPASEIEVYGASARLHLSCYRFDGLSLHPSSTYPGDLVERARNTIRALAQGPRFVQALARGGDFSDTFYRTWDHFITCIREDREPESSMTDGRRAARIARAAEQSFLSGENVRLAVLSKVL